MVAVIENQKHLVPVTLQHAQHYGLHALTSSDIFLQLQS